MHHVTFEDESIHGTSGTLAPKGVAKAIPSLETRDHLALAPKPR